MRTIFFFLFGILLSHNALTHGVKPGKIRDVSPGKGFQRLVSELQELRSRVDSSDRYAGQKIRVKARYKTELIQLLDHGIDDARFLDSLARDQKVEVPIAFERNMDIKADKVERISEQKIIKEKTMVIVRYIMRDLFIKREHAMVRPADPLKPVRVDVTTWLDKKRSGIFAVWFVQDDYKHKDGKRFNSFSNENGYTSQEICPGVYQFYLTSTDKVPVKKEFTEVIIGKGKTAIPVDMHAILIQSR